MSKIYVSAGHGGKDPGAVKGIYREKDYNLAISNEIIKLLTNAGHTVYTDRTTDKDSKLNDKIKQANSLKVDCVVEIHLNAGGGTGCEAYHTYLGGAGKTLAEKICSEIAKLGYKNRGAKVKKNALGRDYFAIVRDTAMPAVLVECCFIDTKADMDRLDVKKMAQAITNGILAVYPAPTKKPVPAPTPAPKAYKVGDVVDFKGGKHYVSSTSDTAVGGNRKAGKAKITAINPKGKHPYHVVGQGTCNVYGWVDKAQIGG
jgi:N-acetylmuramoyl-L-alanine amidase